MANKRIQDLPIVPSIDGSEEIPINKGGITNKATTSQIKTYLDITFESKDNKESVSISNDANKYPSSKAVFNAFTNLKGSSNKSLSQIETDYNSKIGKISKRCVDFTTDNATTRLQINETDRTRNFMLSYNIKTEQYIGSIFSDAEWVKDANWQTLATKDYIDGQLVGVYDDVADFNASLGTFPTTGSGSTGYVMRADCYPVTVAGTVGGLVMKVGDILKAKVDNPAQISSNWVVMRNGVAYVPEDLANKNSANGYAGLDAAKKLANDIIRTDFRMSQGYIFDGVDDYLSIAHNDKLNFGTGDFSIQCVFTVTPSSLDELIVGKRTDYGNIIGFYIRKAYNNKITFNISNTVEYSISTEIITSKITISTFFVSLNGILYLYVNGALIRNISFTPININCNNPLMLAAREGRAQYLNGGISLLRLFNRGLSQSDVTYYENNGRPDLQRLKYADKTNCVLELLPQNALPDRWLESQNGLDAITNGNPAINTETPVTDYSIVDNVTNNIAVGTANRDYTLPAGYIVDSVCVNSTVALTALQLVNITTSETLLTGKTVSASANKHLPITADQSSSKVNTTIRLNCVGNTGLGFNIVINIKKCL